MATFHIKQQSGTIQQADVIHNHAGLPGDLTDQLTALLVRLREPSVVDGERAEQAAAQLVAAIEEASRPQARPGRVRAALATAADLLAPVASAAGLVGSLQAIVTALPLG
ncbi:hypothetical protein [Streptomyces sp. NPDC050264]|uniref:hypothetical protein n=1 Tax=Streptomyces sp. NPDC050264 TaxID=3155038 RepID=UPI00341375CB